MPAFAPRPTLSLALLAALPLLAACNPGGAIVQPVPRAENPQEAACRREAARRPEVVALMRQQPPIDNITWYQRWQAEVAAAGENHPALVSVTRKSFNKKHDLPASTIEAVEDALVADRQELGRMLARSAFAQEAVIVAAEDARRRLGRELPPPPQKLSNRPPRRRPAR